MAGVKMSDIAQRVGVSVAAVSMALNGRPGVSEAMRARILAEATACGYDMSRLSTAGDKKTKILVYDLDYGMYSGGREITSELRNSFMKGVETAAAASNIEVLHALSRTGHLEPADLPAGVDGVLIVNVLHSDTLAEEIRQCPVPCVVVGNSYRDLALPTVSYSNHAAVEAIVRRLAAVGHRSIGFVCTPASNLVQNDTDRLLGWASGHALIRQAPGPILDVSGGLDEICDELTRLLPAHLPQTTAFVTWNDYIALATVRALRACGVTPGRDVAVVGFDDQPFAALSDPPLATVRLNEPALSACGMQYLLSRIRQPDQPVTQHYLPLEWVPRESFCPAPGFVIAEPQN